MIAELVLGGGPSGNRQEGVPGIAAVERGGVRAHRGDRAGEMFEEDSGEGRGNASSSVENRFDDLVTRFVQVMAAKVVTKTRFVQRDPRSVRWAGRTRTTDSAVVDVTLPVSYFHYKSKCN